MHRDLERSNKYSVLQSNLLVLATHPQAAEVKTIKLFTTMTQPRDQTFIRCLAVASHYHTWNVLEIVKKNPQNSDAEQLCAQGF